jgi:hypothetical protein
MVALLRTSENVDACLTAGFLQVAVEGSERRTVAYRNIEIGGVISGEAVFASERKDIADRIGESTTTTRTAVIAGRRFRDKGAIGF